MKIVRRPEKLIGSIPGSRSCVKPDSSLGATYKNMRQGKILIGVAKVHVME